MWFDPNVMSEALKANTSQRQAHTHACKTLIGDERIFCEMDLVDQDYVLECNHPSHDAVKILFKYWSDAPLNKDIEEGHLF